MKTSRALFCVVALCSASVLSAEEDIRRDAVVRAVEQVAPAVVNIATERLVEIRDPIADLWSDFFRPYRQLMKQQSLGSGVFVHPDGYLITNYHVVQRASRIAVILNDGTQLEGKFVAGSEANDLALVKVTRSEPFPTVTIAHADDVYLGETVIAIGNPLGYGNSVSRGIISSKNRTAVDSQGNVVIEGVLQTDAAINPGNSGGPLIDLRGHLVGINTAIVREAQNIGFAIPSRRVLEMLAHWLTPEKRKGVWFGLKVRQERDRVVVAEVQPDSPSARVKIGEGQVVVEVDGQTVRSVMDVLAAVLAREAGQTVKLTLEGSGPRVAEVKLVPLPKFSGSELARRKLGLQLQELTPDLARALALSSVRGVLISDVVRDGSAWRAGLRRGHVIIRIGGSDVNSLDDVARVLEDVPHDVNLALLVISSSRQGAAIFEQISRVIVTTQ